MAFASVESVTLDPDPAGEAGFEEYVRRYKAGLAAQKDALNGELTALYEKWEELNA